MRLIFWKCLRSGSIGLFTAAFLYFEGPFIIGVSCFWAYLYSCIYRIPWMRFYLVVDLCLISWLLFAIGPKNLRKSTVLFFAV